MNLMRVCVVTGTRAEFGIWRPVLAAIQKSPVLKLQLIVTGMHLLPSFGNTIAEIERTKISIAARAPMYQPDEPAAKSLARGIESLAAAFQKLQPDIVMVLGDRLEMLAAASAALTQRIAIAHVHGGETAPGIWDEQIRHALTKMAHLHFCSTAAAKKRILQMGEAPASVHVVGAPALDLIEDFWQTTGPIAGKVRNYRRQGKREEEALLLLHPSGGTADEECARTNMILDTLRRLNLSSQCIGPNNDPGHEGILRAYHQAGIKVIMNQSQGQFWNTLVYSSVLVGNSSAGIIEAASLGIPVINVGNRQAGRQRNQNVIDVAWQPKPIAGALRRALSDATFRRRISRRANLYGDGHASERIVKVLEKAITKGIPLEKRFHDVTR